MGRGFAGRVAGQHPDLIVSDRTDTRFRVVVLVLLALDGVISAVASALFLPLYIGHFWFPVSALVAGSLNAALVWAAMQWATTTRIAALPLITWLVTIGVFTLGGPGGDIVLGGAGIAESGPLVLMVVGAAPAVWLLWRSGARRIESR